MSYRDDLAAAHARIRVLESDLRDARQFGSAASARARAFVRKVHAVVTAACVIGSMIFAAIAATAAFDLGTRSDRSAAVFAMVAWAFAICGLMLPAVYLRWRMKQPAGSKPAERK